MLKQIKSGQGLSANQKLTRILLLLGNNALNFSQVKTPEHGALAVFLSVTKVRLYSFGIVVNKPGPKSAHMTLISGTDENKDPEKCIGMDRERNLVS